MERLPDERILVGGRLPSERERFCAHRFVFAVAAGGGDGLAFRALAAFGRLFFREYLEGSGDGPRGWPAGPEPDLYRPDGDAGTHGHLGGGGFRGAVVPARRLGTVRRTGLDLAGCLFGACRDGVGAGIRTQMGVGRALVRAGFEGVQRLGRGLCRAVFRIYAGCRGKGDRGVPCSPVAGRLAGGWRAAADQVRDAVEAGFLAGQRPLPGDFRHGGRYAFTGAGPAPPAAAGRPLAAGSRSPGGRLSFSFRPEPGPAGGAAGRSGGGIRPLAALRAV